MAKWPWFERKFDFDFPAEKFPDVVERLRGTPARIEESIAQFSSDIICSRDGETWSIQENVGHLADLEPLWIGRLEEIIRNENEMRPADLTNQPTFDADHNSRRLAQVCSEFRELRNRLVGLAESLKPNQWSMTSLHPRLKVPMRTVDHCLFVAEHDDYHLARMRELANILSANVG